MSNETTAAKNAEKEKLDPIRALAASAKEIEAFHKNVKDIRLRLDGILNHIREKEKAEAERLYKEQLELQAAEERREEERRAAEAEAARLEAEAEAAAKAKEKAEANAGAAEDVAVSPREAAETEEEAKAEDGAVAAPGVIAAEQEENGAPAQTAAVQTVKDYVPQSERKAEQRPAAQGKPGDKPPRREDGAAGTRTFTPRESGTQYRPSGQQSQSGTVTRTFTPREGGGAGARPFPPRGDRPFTPGSRPYTPGGAPRTPSLRGPAAAPAVLPPSKEAKKSIFDKKKPAASDDKRPIMNKRTLIRKGYVVEDEERIGTRKLKNKKAKEPQVFAPIKIEHAVITTENLTVKLLSEKIGKTANEIIKQLMVLGIMANINSVVDFATMELVAGEMGVTIELKLDKSKEEQVTEAHDEAEDAPESLQKRPPIVTVMGHVDHGKTSLLDAIRKTNVVTGEAGGITQHIGAYSVTAGGEKITFIDTPGHEAFTAMRARGAKVTDVAIIVVAADDGVMPQTVEAINHAKAAGVPVVVAINKMDKPGVTPDRIKQQLTEHNMIAEEWGGDVMMVPVSAKSGMGIDKLLEGILVTAEVLELKANYERKARGTIVEAKLDKGKGPVATIIVQNGTLHVGDYVVSGTVFGKIRAMQDEKGRSLKEAGPSTAVEVLGFSEVPVAGETMYVADEKLARQAADERSNKARLSQSETGAKVTLDDVFTRISEGQIKSLNIVVKADVQGSVEALKASLNKLSNDEVKINTVHGGVGAINKSDLMLAEASKAIIIGFNVRPDAETKQLAEEQKTDIRLYRIIYEALEDIEAAMKGMLEPKFREEIVGTAEVRNVFKISGTGMIAGCICKTGKIIRSCKVRVIRDGIVIHEGNISSLKRHKDDVKEVASGFEFGISIDSYNDIKEGDVLEGFSLEKITA